MAVSMRQVGSSERWRGALTALALIGSSVLLTLAIAEAAMRFAYRHITTTADNYSYFARRWYDAHAAEISAAGFREREYSPHAAAGVVRIAVIGDSFTFGSGIELNQRLTNRLEAELNRRGGRFEVLNFGKPGHETEHEIETLRQVLDEAHPDFVLVQWFVNDVEGRNKQRPQPLPLLPSIRVDYFLKRHSALYFFLNKGWVQLQVSQGWVKSKDDYMKERFGDPHSPASEAGTRAFKELLLMPRAAGIGVGAFLYPPLDGIDGDPKRFSNGFIIDRTLATCREINVRCVDLRPDLMRLQPLEKRWANELDHHPSGETNRVATQAVLRAFEQDWLALALNRARSCSSNPA
jgi:GDSL-like Lipase/Acylhydrolase family